MYVQIIGMYKILDIFNVSLRFFTHLCKIIFTIKMNSKLPPKYTILFLLLFTSISNRGEIALNDSAKLYPAGTATTGEAFFVSAFHSSFVSDDPVKLTSSVLESYQWYADIVAYI